MLDEMTQKFVKFYGIVLKYSTSTAQKPKVDFSTFHFGIVYFTLSLIGVPSNIYIHSLIISKNSKIFSTKYKLSFVFSSHFFMI